MLQTKKFKQNNYKNIIQKLQKTFLHLKKFFLFFRLKLFSTFYFSKSFSCFLDTAECTTAAAV